ncbi:hypothetical protein [Kitasatospora sp. NPDC094015]|uniref:hypothetical protein n=1 Tax=Kitasatospora sp. NPDC094015 TaxID=3155205 RepID=UPI00332C01C8
MDPGMFRYEPVPRDAGVEEALAARIGDAAHLLARQYAFGEFCGDDAASPVHVALAQETHLLDGWRTGSGTGTGGGSDADGDSWQPYDPARMVLEELVEREPVRGPDARLALAGGLRWQRELVACGLGALLPAFATVCPGAVGGPLAPAPLGVAVRGRLPDAVALAPWLARLAERDETAAKEFGAATADLAALAGAASRWLAWWAPRVPTPAAGPEAPADGAGTADGPARPAAWDANRLEYAFAVRASTLPELELRAQEYLGGHLDWWAVDAPPAQVPVTEAAVTREQRAIVPTPALFGGMPATRFWEMEDARINFGAVDTSPADLGRLLLIAFTTVYGNDWFCCPLPTAVGSLSRVVHCSVTDVFGGTTVLAPAALEDSGWNLYGLGEDSAGGAMGGGGDGSAPAPSPWFYRAASLPAGLEGPPAESVLLLRDEAANLAWAVEETVGDLAGEPLDRYARWVAALPERPVARPGDPPADRYVLATDVPGHWYPLVPQPLDPAAPQDVRLVLAGLVRDEGTPAQPLGGLLREQQWLFEEEVPRSGVRVERSRQYTRWHDGSVHAWGARRKVSGAGGGSSGLRFDVLEPPSGPAAPPQPEEPAGPA